MLHRAACKTISGRPARGSTFMGEYSKVCGTREELQRFAGSLGGEPRPCRICLRELAVPSRGGGRYGPLRDFLASRSDNATAMAFADIEDLRRRTAGISAPAQAVVGQRHTSTGPCLA